MRLMERLMSVDRHHGDFVRVQWKGKTVDGAPVEYVPGVPSRDILDSEFQTLDPEAREAARKSPLHEVMPEKEASTERKTRREQAAADHAAEPVKE